MRFISLTFLLLLAACDDQETILAPTQVVTDLAEVQEYFPKRSFVGRLNAQEDVQIQARITGYLDSIDFREGQNVDKGQLLYSIDPREFEAALASSEADLAAAKANQNVAQLNYNRGLELLPKKAISQSGFDDLTANKYESDAGLAAALARVKTAEVNLSFTKIRAPISGRIGRSQPTTGDLIGPNSGVLTTLVSMDPIEAIFQISEAAYIVASEQRLAEGRGSEIEVGDIEVSLELTNRSTYPLKGYIDYFANRIDDNTGTLETRALIPNPDGRLVPGQYVRVGLQLMNPLTGLFIPQAAVQADQQGSFALVVDPGKLVVRRNIEVADRRDADVRVIKGLDSGDEVIVRGLQLVRPGQVVRTRSVKEAGD